MRDEGAEGLGRFINFLLVLVAVISLATTLTDLIYGRLDFRGHGGMVVHRLLALLALFCGLVLCTKLGFGGLWAILHRHDNTAWDRIRSERERAEGEVHARRIERMDDEGPGTAT